MDLKTYLKSFCHKGKSSLHPALQRNNDLFASFNRHELLDHYDFVVFDTELTGLNPRRDELLSIGAVRIKNLRIMAGDIFHSYIRPKSLKPRDSTYIHRITPQQLISAPEISTVLLDFIDFLGPSLLIGHCVDLDLGFVNRAMKKHLGGIIKNPYLDTLRLAQAYTVMRWKQFPERYSMRVSFNLSELAASYHLPSFAKHDALQDAIQTAYLFLFLLKKIQEPGNIATLSELFAAEFSGSGFFHKSM